MSLQFDPNSTLLAQLNDISLNESKQKQLRVETDLFNSSWQSNEFTPPKSKIVNAIAPTPQFNRVESVLFVNETK